MIDIASNRKSNPLKTSEQSKGEIPTSVYLHIPFCRRRCYYCDFPVSVVGDRKQGESSGTIQQYVELLLQEITITPVFCQPLKTVFFGGGTPSLLSVNQLDRILETLDRRFGMATGIEISMEMDPGTFDRQQLEGYRAAGVNRVSLGSQAFQDELLSSCGRSHRTADIFAAVDLIHQVGISNFSLDLISGLPNQTLKQWQESLETAVTISPTHISCYDLVLEPVTAFGRYYEAGVHPLPTDELTAQMYGLASQILTHAGYEHYEISNYAKPGYQCRHNRVYWENRPYYGLGMGAASYVGGQRFTRPRKTREYYEWVNRLKERDGAIDCPPIPPEEVLLETLMLRLRLAEGLNLATLAREFGTPTVPRLWKSLQPYYQQGWVQVLAPDGEPIDLPDPATLPLSGRVRLADPEGFLFSNTVLATLFSALG